MGFSKIGVEQKPKPESAYSPVSIREKWLEKKA
jgi:hypothetical protein